MTPIEKIREELIRHNLYRHGSSLGWRQAAKYTRYLARCRKTSPVPSSGNPVIREEADKFKSFGVASIQTPAIIAAGVKFANKVRELEKHRNIWAGDAGTNVRQYQGNVLKEHPELLDLLKTDIREFLVSVYGCPYKIFYMKFLKSLHEVESATGSQLWHSDAGPGTCINALFFPEGVSKEHGAIEVLPMTESRKLFVEELRERRKLRKSGLVQHETKSQIRDFKAAYYTARMQKGLTKHVVQPTSNKPLFVFFRNNSIHKGGFPEKNYDRLALMLHFYPSSSELDLEKYALSGLPKTAPYPVDPAFGE